MSPHCDPGLHGDLGVLAWSRTQAPVYLRDVHGSPAMPRLRRLNPPLKPRHDFRPLGIENIAVLADVKCGIEIAVDRAVRVSASSCSRAVIALTVL